MFVFKCLIILKKQAYPYEPEKKGRIPMMKIVKVIDCLQYVPDLKDTKAAHTISYVR